MMLLEAQTRQMTARRAKSRRDIVPGLYAGFPPFGNSAAGQPSAASRLAFAAGGAQESSSMPRIVTYNVHRCVGNDRRLDVARIAEVLARLRPDIVALQELDVGRARTNGVDQAHEIAARLDM